MTNFVFDTFTAKGSACTYISPITIQVFPSAFSRRTNMNDRLFRLSDTWLNKYARLTVRFPPMAEKPPFCTFAQIHDRK